MKKKIIKRSFFAALVLISAMLVVAAALNLYIYHSTKSRVISTHTVPDGEYDCILILGAGLRPDGSPSGMLAERLERGLELYLDGVSGKILVSGDHGNHDYDEVGAMKEYLVANGVPSEDVFMDHAGFSTYDSIYRAKEIFGCKSICIVTQKYHLYRALYLADKKGLESIGADAQRVIYRGQNFRELRECAARVKDVFSVFFNVSPRFLGENIPISGNGDITNDK